MFVNERQHYRTVDHDRAAVLRRIIAGGDEDGRPHLFVVEWDGRRIPFKAYARLSVDPVTGAEALRWEAFGIGFGFECWRENLVDYAFGSDKEHADAETMILEALKVHGIGAIDNVPPTVEAVLARAQDHLPS